MRLASTVLTVPLLLFLMLLTISLIVAEISCLSLSFGLGMFGLAVFSIYTSRTFRRLVIDVSMSPMSFFYLDSSVLGRIMGVLWAYVGGVYLIVGCLCRL